jgi:hypothetical protein
VTDEPSPEALHLAAYRLAVRPLAERASALRVVIEHWPGEYGIMRKVPLRECYYSALLYSARSIFDLGLVMEHALDAQLDADYQRDVPATPDDVMALGHANLLACCDGQDFTAHLAERVARLDVLQPAPVRCQMFSRAFAGVALGMRALYRDVGDDDEQSEAMPFTPSILCGTDAQALLAHLAAGAANCVGIEDVWPAFRECVHKFPYHEHAGDLDGACLLWIARIVHHQVGGGPLGHTADWLSQHFNAWANGHDLPPMGAP